MIHLRLEREIKEVNLDVAKAKDSQKRLEKYLDVIQSDNFLTSHKTFSAILKEIFEQRIHFSNMLHEWDSLFHKIHEFLDTKTNPSNKDLYDLIRKIDSLNNEKTSPINSYAAELNLLALNFALGIFKNTGKSREFAIEDENKRKEVAQIAENFRLFAEEFRQQNEKVLKSSDSLKTELVAAFQELGVSLNVIQKLKLSWI